VWTGYRVVKESRSFSSIPPCNIFCRFHFFNFYRIDFLEFFIGGVFLDRKLDVLSLILLAAAK
jgi:hypothetical protein